MYIITQINLEEKDPVDAVTVWPFHYDRRGDAIVAVSEEAEAMLGEAAELHQDNDGDFILNDVVLFKITEIVSA